MKNKTNFIITNRIGKKLKYISHIVRLKKSNRKNLIEFSDCISEILVKSNISRGTQKGFLINSIIHED